MTEEWWGKCEEEKKKLGYSVDISESCDAHVFENNVWAHLNVSHPIDCNAVDVNATDTRFVYLYIFAWANDTVISARLDSSQYK